MQMRGNTIFITGGTSGIGRGLAEAFHERGNQIIVAGRREDRLNELCEKHAGMRYFVLDVTDAAAIRDVAGNVIAEFPKLNCVFNNAGIQLRFNFAPGHAIDKAALLNEINTNLVGAIRVALAFIPHLSGQRDARLVNVSSGLAFVPNAETPIYCATKAAVHSWTMSLRHHLRDSGIKVVELIPPYVATELGGPGKLERSAARGRTPMLLDDFIAETMKALETDADELPIDGAKRLVETACMDRVKQAFSAMNQ